jgi:hypothetical protein
MHPPDILHTFIHGSLEYSLGFTLQIIKLISCLDKTGHGSSPKLLQDAIRMFPKFSALQPVRHIHFANIWDLVPSKNSKSKGKETNTTKLLVISEFFKIPAAFFQVMLCCSNSQILPDSYDWCKSMGFEEPYFNPLQVVVNSMFSLLIVYWYLHAPSLTENQIVTLQHLVSNSQGHLLVLDVVRKLIIHKNKPLPKKKKGDYLPAVGSTNMDTGTDANLSHRTATITGISNSSNTSRSLRGSSSISSSNTSSSSGSSSTIRTSSSSSSSNSSSSSSSSRLSSSSSSSSSSTDSTSIEVHLHSSDANTRGCKSSNQTLTLENVPLLMNPKFELLSHFPQCIRDPGCDNSVRDTEIGELFMKLIRCIWNTTSKKYSSIDYEMLKKFLKLQFLDIIKRGINHRLGLDIFKQKRPSIKKAYMSDAFITQSEIYKFACNCTTRAQSLQWNSSKSTFESIEGGCLNVHNLLLDVRTLNIFMYFLFFFFIFSILVCIEVFN